MVLAATPRSCSASAPSYADLEYIQRHRRRGPGSRGTAFLLLLPATSASYLLRLTEDVTDELYRQGDIWFSGAGEPTAEVAEALQKIGALYREHGAVLRAIVQAAATDDEVAVFWHAILDRFVDATARRIDELRSDGGTVVAEDARATAFALCWMIERAFNQQLRRRASRSPTTSSSPRSAASSSAPSTARSAPSRDLDRHVRRAAQGADALGLAADRALGQVPAPRP